MMSYGYGFKILHPVHADSADSASPATMAAILVSSFDDVNIGIIPPITIPVNTIFDRSINSSDTVSAWPYNRFTHPNTLYTFRMMDTGMSCSVYSGDLLTGMRRMYPSLSDGLTFLMVRCSVVTIPYISPAGM